MRHACLMHLPAAPPAATSWCSACWQCLMLLCWGVVGPRRGFGVLIKGARVCAAQAPCSGCCLAPGRAGPRPHGQPWVRGQGHVEVPVWCLHSSNPRS
jgi:hypothetical protein